MGFLYSPSCVAGYKLTGNETGRKAAILAADQLIRRFHPVGNFYTGVGCDGCTGKLPADHRLSFKSAAALLGVGGDRRSEVSGHCGEAYSHGVANVIREDHSTWHTFFLRYEDGGTGSRSHLSGIPRRFRVGEGSGVGIYGMALAYKYTEREEYIQKFRDVTDFFLAHLPRICTVLGSGVHGRGRSAERFLLGVDRGMRNA